MGRKRLNANVPPLCAEILNRLSPHQGNSQGIKEFVCPCTQVAQPNSIL